MAKKVTAYAADDGTLFVDEAKADEYNRKFVFELWYENDNELSGQYAGSRVNTNDMTDWLDKNREKVLAYYGV